MGYKLRSLMAPSFLWKKIHVLRESYDIQQPANRYHMLILSKNLQTALINWTISKEVTVINLKSWLPLQGLSWCQEESWNKTSGKPLPRSLTLQSAKDTHWERFQLFPDDHTRNYDFAHWCTSSWNKFPELHNLQSWNRLLKIWWGIVLIKDFSGLG